MGAFDWLSRGMNLTLAVGEAGKECLAFSLFFGWEEDSPNNGEGPRLRVVDKDDICLLCWYFLSYQF